MRQTIKNLGPLVGALLCSVSAQAADLPSRTAPPIFTAAPISYNDWSGVYVGSTYGYGFNSFRNRQAGSRSVTADGQTGGALVGYNFQSGHFVYGVEGSIDLNVIRANNPGNAGLVPAKNDSLYDIRFRGVLGYEMGKFMPFVAGGAVLNEGYQSGTGGIGRVPNWYGQTHQTVGWTVGAGLDYKLNPRELFPWLPTFIAGGPLILRAEYICQNLPNQTYAYGGQTYRTKSDGSFIRGAIIYRFGDQAPRPYADSTGNVNWAGGYGGLLGGYGDVTAHTRSFTRGRTNLDADGGLGGIYAGSNFMFGRYMLGFDGSTSFSDFTGNGAEPGAANVHYRNYIQADIRARAGYAFGNFLPFVAAGVAFARSEQIDRATGSERGRVPTDAITVGGGLDYRLSERVSLRVEDLYEFNSNRKIVNLNGCGDCSQKRDGNIVRAGLAYHFE